MRSATSPADCRLEKVGLRAIELYGRPCLQCATCQRASAPKLQAASLNQDDGTVRMAVTSRLSGLEEGGGSREVNNGEEATNGI